MSQGPLRLLRQTDDHRQGSVRAQFDQPAQRHLGESRLETAAGRLAQEAEQLRGVAHAGLTAVDRHQTPAAARRWLRSLSETFTPVNCCTWAASVPTPHRT